MSRIARIGGLAVAIAITTTIVVWRPWLVDVESPRAGGPVDPERGDETFEVEPGTRHALLIGIEDYADALPALAGPRRDVERLRDLLERRFGFESSKTTVLLDADATLAGIVGAIDEKLLQRARPGDEALVYVAAHGSRVRDASGREKGGADSTIVAWDSRRDGRDGSFDLTDDALYSLLRVLTERGVLVTVLTDCCHAGGVVRGHDRYSASRFVAAGRRPVVGTEAWDRWPERVEFVDDDGRESVELTNYVHVAACAHDERAFEFDVGGESHGVFTWFLLDALRRARRGDSWGDVARRVGAAMRASPDAPLQTVSIEGDVDRELFGARFVPASPHAFRGRVLAGGRIEFGAGRLHGAFPGAVLAVVGEGGGEPLGTARVVAAQIGRAIAVWEERVADAGAVEPGTLVEADLAERPLELPPLVVDAGPELRNPLATVIAGGWARGTRAGERADYLLARDAEGRARFAARAGDVTIWRARDDGVSGLARAVREEVQFRAIWRLAAPTVHDGDLAIDGLRVTWVEPTSAELADTQPGATGVAVRPRRRARAGVEQYEAAVTAYDVQDDAREQHLGVLELVNDGESDLDVTVLSLSESREVDVLHPATRVGDRVLAARGGAVRVPVWIGRAEGWPAERPLLDRYLVFATAVGDGAPPIDFHSFVDRRVQQAVRGDADDLGMPGVLRAVFGRERTRGATRARVLGAERAWNVVALDVVLRAPSGRGD